MLIDFSSLNKSPYDLNLSIGNVCFTGRCTRKTSKLAELEMKMRGFVDALCNSCGQDLRLDINEDIRLILSTEEVRDSGGSISDIIELYGDKIDFLEIANAELESFLSSYFYCKECE